MQLKKLLLFLLFLFTSHSLSAQVIDNSAKVILKGTFKPLTILEIKVHNQAYPHDIHYAFIESDGEGKWVLNKEDIELSKIQDGEVIFDVGANNNPAIIEHYSFVRTLDKGLLLEVSILSDNEYNQGNYINVHQMNSLSIHAKTETNIKNINLEIRDTQNNTLSFTQQDIYVDEKGEFTLSGIDISHFVDGEVSFSIKADDTIGNRAEVLLTMIKDSIVEKIVLLKRIKNNNLSNVVNKKILVASGSGEAFATVYIEFNQGKVKIVESVEADKDGTWELLGGDLDITIFESSDVFVNIYQKDLANNKSQLMSYIFKKFKKPIFPITPLLIDPEKYQLIHTISEFSDEVKSIAITDKELFVGSFESVKVFSKSYAKLLRELEIKNSWANSLKVLNAKLFVGLSSGYMNVYDEKSLTLLKVIKVSTLPLLHLEISDNNIISSSSDGEIKVFDSLNYENIFTLKNHQWDVGAIAVDGSTLYSGSDDYSIKIWDLKTGKLIKTLKSAHEGTINDIIIYDNMLISAADDKKIIIRDLKSGKIQRVLTAHKDAVNRLKVTNDFLISVGSDRAIILWDMKSGKVLKRLKGHAKRIMALDVNDENIVTGSRDYKLKIWGYDDSRVSLDSEDETKKPIYAMVKSFKAAPTELSALTQNDTSILVSTYGYIYFYDKITYNFIKKYSTLDEIEKPKREVKEKEIVAISSEDEIEFDDEESEDDSYETHEDETPLTLQKIYDIDIFGTTLIAALNDSTLKMWNLEDDKSILSLAGHELASTSLDTSNQYLFAGSKKGSISVYDMESKELLNLLEGHQYNVNTVAVYNEELIISAGDDYSIKIRDIESGDTILDIKNAHDDIINKIIVSGDKLISASSDSTIKVRDIESGKLLQLLTYHSGAVISLDADETNLISASDDKTLKVFSLKDFSLVTTMQGHKDGVTDVMITDDYIISSSKDKTIKVWKYYE